MIFRVNEDSIPRIEKLIIHKLSLLSWNLYQAMELDACHVIYTVNHVTKCPCRLWAAHNSHPCSLNVGTRKKKFDGLPDSSLNNECVVLTYYQKSNQGKILLLSIGSQQ